MVAQVTLLVLGGGKEGSSIVIADQSNCLIGRSQDCDLRLGRSDGYEGIDAHHCIVEVDLPAIRVRELCRDSSRLRRGRAGRYDRDNRLADSFLPGSYDVSAGEEIKVGNAVLRVGVLIAAEEFPSCVFV